MSWTQIYMIIGLLFAHQANELYKCTFETFKPQLNIVA